MFEIRYVEVDSDHKFVPSLQVRKKTEVFEATELSFLWVLSLATDKDPHLQR